MKKLITFCLLLFLGTTQLKAHCPVGISWKSRISAANDDRNSLTYGNGLFVTVSQSGKCNSVMFSSVPISFTSYGINYVVTSPTTVEVGLNPNAIGEIVIPTTVTFDGSTYSVTSIGINAFFYSSLTSITIPNSVISIGNRAFAGCSGLTSLVIPNSVSSIGDIAFAQSGLTSVTIPNSVTSINYATFAQCPNLTSVTIPNSVTNIDVAAFAFSSSLTSMTIPNSVVSIGASVFFGCNGLASVTIPASVTSIGDYVFNSCSSLTSVICNVATPIAIPANVFQNVNQAACSLAVPNGSVAAYQAAAVWKNFAPIFSYSKVIDSQCGSILSTLNSPIFAKAVIGASGYRFKVVHGATTQIIEAESGRWFRLSSLQGGTFYNTNYTISVATKYNNHWGEYGEECNVTTPAFPLTKVRDSQCGVTLASINTYISPNRVWNNTGYRYKVVNGASTHTIEAVGWFRLTSLPVGAFYNTTYTISVATRYNGVWSEYGEECTVTTPSAPLSKLIDRQCGMTLASGNATLLYATAVSVAQKYRFEVSLGSDVYTYDTASSSERSFRMTNVPGLTLVSGTTYAVRVAIMVNDAWQPYGESCNITTFGGTPNFVKTLNVDTTNFNVVTYPNPFTENFNLNLTSLSEEKVTVMVYDMTGKLLERKAVVPSELSELQIGTNFASGVYNVIVSQGTNTKSLRVIKK